MHIIPLRELVVPENRQRREFDPAGMVDLADSISKSGLLNPLTIRFQDERPVLVAGERRLRAIKDIWALGGAFKCDGKVMESGLVPCLSVGDLPPLEAFEVELEENIRRMDLTWQERDTAIARLHHLREQQAAALGCTHRVQDTTEEMIGMGLRDTHPNRTVSRAVLLARNMHDPDIAQARTSEEAYKILVRKDEAALNAERGRIVGLTFGAHSHQLIKGDCLEILQDMEQDQFDVICTDPPYGMDADGFGNAAGKLIEISHSYDDSVDHFMRLMSAFGPAVTRVAKPAAHLYLCCDIEQFPWLKSLFLRLEWNVFRTPLINCKPGSGRVPLPENGPRRQYETILYAFRGGKRVTGIYSDVLSTQGDENLGHGAQKPVALFRELLKRSVGPGDRVIDPFAGTGTIFPAAHDLRCYATGIEREEAYFGIAVKRLEALKEAA